LRDRRAVADEPDDGRTGGRPRDEARSACDGDAGAVLRDAGRRAGRLRQAGQDEGRGRSGGECDRVLHA
jgi:hypothetical protein